MKRKRTSIILLAGAILLATPRAEAEKIPRVKSLVLQNGLTVMLMEDHSIPLVNVEYRGRAGSIMDPHGKDGLAFLTATLLTYGTKKHSEDELNEAIASLGAQLVASAGTETFSVGGSVPTIEPGTTERYLDLLAQVLLHPTFPKAGFERARARRIGQVKGLADKRAVLARRALLQWLFPNHPYGRHVSGTGATLASVEREDAVRFHSHFVLPDDAVIGVSGDFDTKAMTKAIRARFGSKTWGRICKGKRCRRRCVRVGRPGGHCSARWLAGGDARPSANPMLQLLPPDPSKGIRVLLVDTGDPTLNQAQIRLGSALSRRYDDPSWHAYHLAAEVLGGNFTARLNARLRIKEGLTYGARWISQFDDLLPAAAYLSTYTDPKSVVRLLTLATSEIGRLQTEPIPEAELTAVKDRLRRSFPFRFETAEATLSEHLGLWQERLPPSHLEKMSARLKKIGQTELKGVLGDFPKADYSIVVIGNKALDPELRKYAESLGGTFEVVDLAWLGVK